MYLNGAVTSRKRGQGYGKRFLFEVSDYIFATYKEVENIKLKISSDNEQSLKTADAAGYTWQEKDYYIKHNPYLENKRGL